VNKLTKELSKLNMTKGLLKMVVSEPDEVLYDSLTGRYIALKLSHNLAVVYE